MTADVHSNWAHCKAFAILEIKARIIAAAMLVLGMNKISDQPTHNLSLVAARSGNDQEKKHYLMKLSGKIVDHFVIDQHSLNSFLDGILSEQEMNDAVNNQELTTDGRFPCRSPGCSKSFKYDGKRRRDHELSHDPPPVIPEKPVLSSNYPKKGSLSDLDDVFNYNCSLLGQGLLFFNFLDSTSEGDGDRSIRCWKFFLLHFKEDKSTTKYALEALYLLLQVYFLLPPAEAHSLVWNRTVNNRETGKNVAIDLDLEHDNNDLKQPIKNLGPTVTEDAVRRISNGQQKSKQMLSCMDREILVKQRSGKHVSADYSKDLRAVVNSLIEESVFCRTPGRQYKHFSNFVRDPLSRLDLSNLYQWINKHKKNIDLARKAR